MTQVSCRLPRAVLVDVDGTNVRAFYHRDRVGEDAPNTPVVELVQLLAASGRYRILVMSARDAVCRPQTEQWLKEHDVPFDELWMRNQVLFVLDDRDQVVQEWRSLGLTCLQVAEGAF